MNLIVGFVIVLGCVGGGFILSKGNLGALWQPFELLIILGAAFGAFVTANPGKVLKAVGRQLGTLVKGSKYKKELFLDALALLHDLAAKARKEGFLAIEADVDEPEASEVFKKYPKILADHHAIEFTTDYLRMLVSGNMNTMELETLMDVELDTHHHEVAVPAAALRTVADGLPGFGIVAAVLGIVIAMASLGGPPEEIGHHVAAALVGTFLGILLAYGFVAPAATFLEHVADDESQFYRCLKTGLLACLQGYSPKVVAEFARKTIASAERPTFLELEERVKAKVA